MRQTPEKKAARGEIEFVAVTQEGRPQLAPEAPIDDGVVNKGERPLDDLQRCSPCRPPEPGRLYEARSVTRAGKRLASDAAPMNSVHVLGRAGGITAAEASRTEP